MGLDLLCISISEDLFNEAAFVTAFTTVFREAWMSISGQIVDEKRPTSVTVVLCPISREIEVPLIFVPDFI